MRLLYVMMAHRLAMGGKDRQQDPISGLLWCRAGSPAGIRRAAKRSGREGPSTWCRVRTWASTSMSWVVFTQPIRMSHHSGMLIRYSSTTARLILTPASTVEKKKPRTSGAGSSGDRPLWKHCSNISSNTRDWGRTLSKSSWSSVAPQLAGLRQWCILTRLQRHWRSIMWQLWAMLTQVSILMRRCSTHHSLVCHKQSLSLSTSLVTSPLFRASARHPSHSNPNSSGSVFFRNTASSTLKLPSF